jgi:hypothetical protein
VNLLVPLYVVIASGVLATVVATIRGQTRLRKLPKPLVLALVVVVSLYALQTIYSPDAAFAARNVGFFLIPFAILFSLLAEATWDRRLLRLALCVLVAEGLILALIGIGQFADQHIFWNPKLETSNDFHFYFRVNSVFWDPNIYGRYIVLTILLATTTLLWAANRVLALALAGAGGASLEFPLDRDRSAARCGGCRGGASDPQLVQQLGLAQHRGPRDPGVGWVEAGSPSAAVRLWLGVVLQGVRTRGERSPRRHDHLTQ